MRREKSGSGFGGRGGQKENRNGRKKSRTLEFISWECLQCFLIGIQTFLVGMS